MGSGSSKPDNGEQPKFVGDLPPPHPIKKINPVMLFYGETSREYVITFNAGHTPTEAVKQLTEKGHLEELERIVFIAHGYQGNPQLTWVHDMRSAILKADIKRKLLVCVFGWEDGADQGIIRYAQAAANGIEAGAWLGAFVKELKTQYPNIYIYGIGHSLGAHLMGSAGRKSQAFDRITGLDPAGVGFQIENIDKRLNRCDAKLVDVLHTDGTDVPYFGTLIPMGTIDIYPNFGYNQPTKFDRMIKPTHNVDSKTNRKIEPGMDQYGEGLSSSHTRAHELFTWSVLHRGAMRSYTRLENEPDVDKPVHRITATCHCNDEPDVYIEMGYWLDSAIDECYDCIYNDSCPSTAKPSTDRRRDRRRDDYSLYELFEGSWFIHTNSQEPFC